MYGKNISIAVELKVGKNFLGINCSCKTISTPSWLIHCGTCSILETIKCNFLIQGILVATERKRNFKRPQSLKRSFSSCVTRQRAPLDLQYCIKTLRHTLSVSFTHGNT